MNNRIWLRLLLLTLSMFVPSDRATAQLPQHRPSRLPFPQLFPPIVKQSHHDLPGGIDLSNAEEIMSQRLQELHQLHELQDQVQGVLQAPEFRERLENLSKSDIQKLQDKMLKGGGLSGDRDWKHLLEQAASRQKLDEQKIDKILRRLTESDEHKPPARSGDDEPGASGIGGGAPGLRSESTPLPTSTLPNTAPPEPSLYDRIQEGTTKWMIANLDSVGGDVVESLSELGVNQETTPLAELMRSMQQPDFSNLNVSEQAMGLSRYLSNAGDFLHRQRGAWDEVQSIFRKAPVPSLPNLGVPSASVPAASTAGGDSWAPALLSLLLLGTIVLFLCLRSLGTQSRLRSGEGDGWRLGSWPVQPGRVSTRQDVIRAFEYLALLCLGPAAGACHHRELAERLAEKDSDNPNRRQAAAILAWLYEQARYAPAGETLSQEQFRDARQALCLLAGVTAP